MELIMLLKPLWLNVKKNLKQQLGELSNEELAKMKNFIGLLEEQELIEELNKEFKNLVEEEEMEKNLENLNIN